MCVECRVSRWMTGFIANKISILTGIEYEPKVSSDIRRSIYLVVLIQYMGKWQSHVLFLTEF